MTKSDRARLAQYADRMDGERFRVTRNGEMHIYGQMPNTTTTRWWFAGFVENILYDAQYDEPSLGGE